MAKIKTAGATDIEKDKQDLVDLMNDNISEEMKELLDESLYISNTEENNNFRIVTRGGTIDAN
ncbi:MAG: hypothetical protein UMU04_06000 [Halanaerobiales bacterium]|jgi:hypothetical protein|nr:hypothetical protein [Halanaerobiales bacterium]